MTDKYAQPREEQSILSNFEDGVLRSIKTTLFLGLCSKNNTTFRKLDISAVK